MGQQKQQGSVLIIALVLLLIATVLSIAGIANMQINEKMAANHKQVLQAFMAAEAGVIQTKAFLDDPANKALWGDDQKTLSALAKINRAMGQQVQWQINSIDFASHPGMAVFVSHGEVSSTGVSREVMVTYKPKAESGNLGAMNIIGGIKIFDTANSNSFQVIGEKDANGNVIGPALATNTEANFDKIVDDITTKNRMDNYVGGVKVVDFDDPFGDPEKMNAFIEAIKAEYYALPLAARGTAPSNMGIPATYDINGLVLTASVPKITYVANSIEFKGQAKGAGILVIEGNLTISGNLFDFDGLVVVRGQTFQMNGGGNRDLLGSIVFANPIKDINTGEWSFGEAQATFVFDINGGGNATFEYNTDALVKAKSLLKKDGVAANMWQIGAEQQSGSASQSSAIMDWTDVTP